MGLTVYKQFWQSTAAASMRGSDKVLQDTMCTDNADSEVSHFKGSLLLKPPLRRTKSSIRLFACHHSLVPRIFTHGGFIGTRAFNAAGHEQLRISYAPRPADRAQDSIGYRSVTLAVLSSVCFKILARSFCWRVEPGRTDCNRCFAKGSENGQISADIDDDF